MLLICILLMTNDVEYHFFLMILGLYSLFFFGCAGSSLLHGGSLQLRQAGATPVVVPGLLTAVASLVAEHRLSNCDPGA